MKNKNQKMNFEQSCEYIKNKTLNNDQLLELYGLYKAATVGACNVPRPKSFLGIRNRETAKWDAWNERSEISQERAKRMYIEFVSKF